MTRPAPIALRVVYVLAGAYRAGDPLATLTHTVRLDGEAGALCGKVRATSVDDVLATDVDLLVPSCKTCAARQAKMIAAGQAVSQPASRAELGYEEVSA